MNQYKNIIKSDNYYPFLSIKQIIEKKFSKADERHYWMNIYHNMLAGAYDTWDFQFLFKMWEKDAVCIIPNENLVTNIGFGNNATHTTDKNDPAANRPLGQINKIIHPGKKEISQEANMDLAIERNALEESQERSVSENEAEVEFTVLDTSFTFGEPRHT